MIARNFRKYPEALALQLSLPLRLVRLRKAEAIAQPPAINTSPAIGLLRFVRKPKDHEDVPVGSIVKTALGLEAKVEGYRGFKRDHRIRLVCRYLKPANKRYDVVLLLPELVVVMEQGVKQ